MSVKISILTFEDMKSTSFGFLHLLNIQNEMTHCKLACTVQMKTQSSNEILI